MSQTTEEWEREEANEKWRFLMLRYRAGALSDMPPQKLVGSLRFCISMILKARKKVQAQDKEIAALKVRIKQLEEGDNGR